MRFDVTAWILGATALVGVALALARTAEAESPERYPYDPVCAWGRLADGHGMLIRCLQPVEASQFLQSSLAEETAPAKAAQPATPTAPTPTAPSPAAPSPAAVKPGAQKLSISVGPAQADTGELPLAASKLGLPKDRYGECVKNHGGLTEKTGRVVVRFLVRERGRAEGVEVKSQQGVSPEAAKCIADVVDRRYVGYPAAPIVGATISIELSLLN